jgi:N-acyl-D-aspartate/D-glutamate deacylase
MAARAKKAGIDPLEFMYDRMIANDGQTLFYSARANYQDGNFDVCREQILHPNTVMGLGDGGAHVGVICDASFTTTLLTHWGRDRSRGKQIDLPFLVKKQTSDTARAVGLTDRGIIKPGLKADINVIDFDNLKVHTPKIVHDLPAGGARFQQKSSGYLATLVSGQVTYENGQASDALPGRLIRAH